MKRNCLRYAACILALVLLLASPVCAASAAEEETGAIVWTVSGDGQEIYGNGNTYSLFSYSGIFTVDPEICYCFENTARIPRDGYYNASVYSYAKDGNILWVVGRTSSCLFYLNQTALEELLGMLNGEIPVYRFADDTYDTMSPLEEADVEALNACFTEEDNLVTLDVRALAGVTRYPIAAYDSTKTLRFEYGAVYLYEGAYHYVNYMNLDNSYFDANGNFSYRVGEVTAARLPDAEAARVDARIGALDLHMTTVVEEVDVIADLADDLSLDETDALIIFWVLYALVGFVLPLPLLVFGLVLPHSEKRGRPKYWYATAISAGAWIVLSAALMLLLI